MRLWATALIVTIALGCPTIRPTVDAGPPTADAATQDGGLGDGGGTRRDAGLPKGPAKYQAHASWLDGGGRLTVRSVWESGLTANADCAVGPTGRLFFTTPSLQNSGMRRTVFAAPDATVGAEPELKRLTLTKADESYFWCDINFPGPPPVQCKRQLVDGGLILAPDRFFDIWSWTASGFISGAVRKVEPGRWRNVWLPDGGIWDSTTEVQFHESGLGTGQFQPLDGGLAVAFLWEDSEIFVLEPPESQESSWGAAVNGAGLVVGQRFVGGANAAAVFWGNETDTLPRRRGYSADLRDVNESGLAVGQERGNRGEWAMIWYRGTTWYLDDLVDAGVGCNYTNAESVNDSNTIAAIRECKVDFTRRCARIELDVTP